MHLQIERLDATYSLSIHANRSIAKLRISAFRTIARLIAHSGSDRTGNIYLSPDFDQLRGSDQQQALEMLPTGGTAYCVYASEGPLLLLSRG